MSRVFVVHWNESECAARAGKVQSFGHAVVPHCRHDDGAALTQQFSAAPPDAIVIDLSRLPSHGRAIATWIRERKALRHVPIVFVPGDADKTERLRQTFPDATFATWRRMKSALRKAIAAPPQDPVVPKAPDYSGTPLPKKLGIRPGAAVVFVRAPMGFGDTLGELPTGVDVKSRLEGELDCVVLFCRSRAELQRDFPRAQRCLGPRGGLWVAWPKKASAMITDLSDGVVRAIGLDCGLVDNKVCAIDATWSGLRFAQRRFAAPVRTP